MKRKCFVICPIGHKGSETRLRADSLYNLIIEPALEKFDFDILRADKNIDISSITTEIVKLVQESDLCIIDITEHNANVMYECGRRHETAKPYIMMAEDGQKLPFDINTIRTIFYNLRDPLEVRNTVKLIQSIIEKMLESGLEPARSGESLTSLSDALARIERKIDNFSKFGLKVDSGSIFIDSTEYREIFDSLGLYEAFNYAVSEKNIGLIEYLLPNAERQLSEEKYISLFLTGASMIGSHVAHQILKDKFYNIETYDISIQKDCIRALVSGYFNRDLELEGLKLMEDFFKKIISNKSLLKLTNEDKAFFMNQYFRLLHGSEKFEEALEMEKLVLNLCPNDMTYIYNYSLVCEQLDDFDSAYNSAKKLFSLMKATNDYDDDHLKQVVELFAKYKDPEIKEAFDKLKEINRYMAAILLYDKEVKSSLKN